MRGKHIKRRLCGEEVANAQATAADTREMLEDVKRLRSELSALSVRNTKLESIERSMLGVVATAGDAPNDVGDLLDEATGVSSVPDEEACCLRPEVPTRASG